VLEVDLARKRIGLTMKLDAQAAPAGALINPVLIAAYYHSTPGSCQKHS
jgi:hypothetical protein